jgi:hypothetical protein
MTLTLPGLIVLITIAAVYGAVGRALASSIWEPVVLRVGGYSFPIMWPIIGGALFVAFLHLLPGRSRILN